MSSRSPKTNSEDSQLRQITARPWTPRESSHLLHRPEESRLKQYLGVSQNPTPPDPSLARETTGSCATKVTSTTPLRIRKSLSRSPWNVSKFSNSSSLQEKPRFAKWNRNVSRKVWSALPENTWTSVWILSRESWVKTWINAPEISSFRNSCWNKLASWTNKKISLKCKEMN